MELTLWTYEGPPHVGAMRIASSMRDIHYVLHAPQGDTYADLLFSSSKPYVDSRFGKLIDAKGANAQYVRLYSNGNTANDMNHYIEVEVYGIK